MTNFNSQFLVGSIVTELRVRSRSHGTRPMFSSHELASVLMAVKTKTIDIHPKPVDADIFNHAIELGLVETVRLTDAGEAALKAYLLFEGQSAAALQD